MPGSPRTTTESSPVTTTSTSAVGHPPNPAALFRAFDSQKSLDTKSYVKLSKGIEGFLEFSVRLSRHLQQRLDSGSVVNDPVINDAKRTLTQIKAVQAKLAETGRDSKKSRKRFFWRRENTQDWLARDERYLSLVCDHLEATIKALDGLEKSKGKPSEVELVHPTLNGHLDHKVIHTESGNGPNVPTSCEQKTATLLFQRLGREVYEYWQRHKQYSQTRVQDTCRWILDRDDQYRCWRIAADNRDSSGETILWLHGESGTGKSVLASAVVESITTHSEPVAYFYCGKDERQQLPDVVGSLLAQLFAFMIERGQRSLNEDFGLSAGEIIQPWPSSRMKEFAKRISPSPVIVLDAWDSENMDRRDRDKLWRLPLDLRDLGFKVLVTCRMLPENMCDDKRDFSLRLPCYAQLDDLQLFADDLIERNQGAPMYQALASDDKLRSKITRNHALGINFPKVQLYIERMLRQASRTSLEDLLEKADQRTFSFGDYLDGHNYITVASLLWVKQKRQPMTITALQEALALMSYHTNDIASEAAAGSVIAHDWHTIRYFPRQDSFPTLGTLLNYSSHQLYVDALSQNMALWHDDLVGNNQPPAIFRNIRNLSDMCVEYLSIEELEDLDPQDSASVGLYYKTYHFLRYAACTWQDHMREQKILDVTLPKYFDLLMDRERLQKVLAIEMWDRYKELNQGDWQSWFEEIEKMTVAHIAVRCGEHECLKAFLGKPNMLEDVVTFDRTTLQDGEIVKLMKLAHQGQQTKCFDVLYDYYLESCLTQETVNYVVVKPDHTRKDEIQDDMYLWFDSNHQIQGFQLDSTRLTNAVEQNDILALCSAFVRTEPGWDRDDIGAFALHTAITAGRYETVLELIGRGFTPVSQSSHRDTHRWSPLHTACSAGTLSIVQELVNNGANINALDEKRNTVLFSAADQAYRDGVSEQTLELIKFLVLQGVSIHTLGSDDITVLEYAARRGLSEIVELLLRHGADPSISAAFMDWDDGTGEVNVDARHNIAKLLEERRRLQQKLRGRGSRSSSSSGSQQSAPRSQRLKLHSNVPGVSILM